MGFDGLFRNPGRRQNTCLHLFSYLPHGLRQFPTGRIAQCDDHRHLPVSGRMLHTFFQTHTHGFRNTGHIADYTETDIVFHENLIFKMVENQSHECRYLGHRTIPVFCGKRI